MKRLSLRLVLMALVCLAQLAVPAWLLAREEVTLQHGESFRFQCRPVDPVDVFRGRFVALGFSDETVSIPDGVRFSPGERVYLRVGHDDEGFARLTEPSKTAPGDGPYLRARVASLSGSRRLNLQLPFARYYLDEDAAPEAESAYRENVRSVQANAYVTVRVRNGHAALEELYLDGVPVRECLRRVASRDPAAPAEE